MEDLIIKMNPLLTISLSLVIGLWTSILANRRGRNPFGWFFLGAFFGLLGLVILLILPRKTLCMEGPLANVTTKPVDLLTPAAPPENKTALMWHYLNKEGKAEGPMSEEALLNLHDEGKITDRTYIWNETLSDWIRFNEVDSLKGE